MNEKARQKLLSEIGSDKGYKQIIGNYLLQQLEANPSAAEQIMKDGKNIKGAMEAMKAEARKRQKDGCGILTDDEGFAIVLEYYDIPMTRIVRPTAVEKLDRSAAPKQASFHVNLDDLLG